MNFRQRRQHLVALGDARGAFAFDACGVQQERCRGAGDVESADQLEVGLRVDLNGLDSGDALRDVVQDVADGDARAAESAGEVHERRPLTERVGAQVGRGQSQRVVDAGVAKPARPGAP